ALVVGRRRRAVIRAGGRWPPRLPKVEFVRKGAPEVKPPVSVVTATRDTFPIPAPMPPPLPDTTPVAAAVVHDTVVKFVTPPPPKKKAPARRAAPKPPAEDKSEDAAWFEQKPTMTIIPTRTVTEVVLSSDPAATAPVPAPAPAPQPAPPPAAPATDGAWPILCGEVVDPSGDPIPDATIHIEGTDQEEHS